MISAERLDGSMVFRFGSPEEKAEMEFRGAGGVDRKMELEKDLSIESGEKLGLVDVRDGNMETGMISDALVEKKRDRIAISDDVSERMELDDAKEKELSRGSQGNGNIEAEVSAAEFSGILQEEQNLDLGTVHNSKAVMEIGETLLEGRCSGSVLELSGIQKNLEHLDSERVQSSIPVMEFSETLQEEKGLNLEIEHRDCSITEFSENLQEEKAFDFSSERNSVTELRFTGILHQGKSPDSGKGWSGGSGATDELPIVDESSMEAKSNDRGDGKAVKVLNNDFTESIEKIQDDTDALEAPAPAEMKAIQDVEMAYTSVEDSTKVCIASDFSFLPPLKFVLNFLSPQ